MGFVALALLNGVLIALARSLNGALAASKNAFYASWVNHLVGFIVASLFVVVFVDLPASIAVVPTYAWFGGVIGALYVIVNAYIVPLLGVTLATVSIISAQLFMSVLLDGLLGQIDVQAGLGLTILSAGCLFVLLGFSVLLKND